MFLSYLLIYIYNIYIYIYIYIYIAIIYSYIILYLYLSINIKPYIYITMGPGPGLVAHVLWRYCMRLAPSGVGGVRRVRLALLYVGRGVWGGCIGHRVPSEG